MGIMLNEIPYRQPSNTPLLLCVCDAADRACVTVQQHDVNGNQLPGTASSHQTLSAHRHLQADFVPCGVHLVQLWQQRVVQELQHCDLRCNTLHKAQEHKQGHKEGRRTQSRDGARVASCRRALLLSQVCCCCLLQDLLYVAVTASFACP